MRINNKGFMLVEVIITSTVVLSAMLFLYSNFNKLYNNYKIKSTYYNIDGVYAAKSLVNQMFDYSANYNINKFLQEFGGTTGSTSINFDKFFLIKNNVCKYSSWNECNDIKNLYKINNAILLEFDKNILGKFKDYNLNQTFKEYVDYLVKYYDKDFSSDSEKYYSYIILVEYGDSKNYEYSSLRLR